MELEITDLARGGKGVAREDSGRVVFVPFTAPGDRVRVRIDGETALGTDSKRRSKKSARYVTAELLEVLRPAPDRVKPRCPVFGRCGGCEWQHLPYALQWKTKVSGVRHALARVGAEMPERPLPTVEEFPAESPWEYRNRIQMRGDRGSLGFFAPGSKQLIPIERCDIARPELNAEFPALREKGRSLEWPYKVELEVLPDGTTRSSWNARHAALGFRQVNDAQNERLRDWVRQAVSPGRVVLDLFGGSGNLASAVASHAREVHCVDVSAPQNGELDSVPGSISGRLRFHRRAVLPWLLDRVAHVGKSDAPVTVIVDPPREGLGETIGELEHAWLALGVDEIIAVGCDPDRWSSDLARLLRRGSGKSDASGFWRVERLAAFDFFPQTHHVEASALLRRVK